MSRRKGFSLRGFSDQLMSLGPVPLRHYERLLSAVPPFTPVSESAYDVNGAFDRTPPDTCVVTCFRRAD